MAVLTKDQIMSARDLETEQVFVEEWGGEVFVRGLTASERDQFEAETVIPGSKQKNFKNFRARLVVLCAVDGKGERLFAAKDAEALGKKSAAAVLKVFKVAQRLSGLGLDDEKDIEENLE